MRSNATHIKRIIETHTKRLEQLELQQASYGINAPPEIATEIDSITAERLKLEASLAALETVNTLASETINYDRSIDRRDEDNYTMRLNIMVATVMATVTEVSSVKKYVNDGFKDVNRLIFRMAIGFVALLVLQGFLLAAFVRLGWL